MLKFFSSLVHAQLKQFRFRAVYAKLMFQLNSILLFYMTAVSSNLVLLQSRMSLTACTQLMFLIVIPLYKENTNWLVVVRSVEPATTGLGPTYSSSKTFPPLLLQLRDRTLSIQHRAWLEAQAGGATRRRDAMDDGDDP